MNMAWLRPWWQPVSVIVILILDQVTKQMVLANLVIGERIEITGYFNLVHVRNFGVSFGMFQAQSDMGRWLLVALALGIVSFIAYLLWNERRVFLRSAYWLVIAGALGNVIDRVRLGSVVDFLDFHIHGYHWPAFNVADSAIVIGAFLLVLDALFFAGNDRQGRESA